MRESSRPARFITRRLRERRRPIGVQGCALLARQRGQDSLAQQRVAKPHLVVGDHEHARADSFAQRRHPTVSVAAVPPSDAYQ
jgi:hypothetical protein